MQNSPEQDIEFKKRPTSSLHINQKVGDSAQVEFVSSNNQQFQNAVQLSDQQKKNQLNRIRQQYFEEKNRRKKQIIKMKRQQFGTSSSQDDDIGVQQSESQQSQSNNVEKGIEQRIKKHSSQQIIYETQGSILQVPKQIYVSQGKQSWHQEMFLLKQNSIFITSNEYQIEKIHKIKSIPEKINNDSMKMKFSYASNQQIIIAASTNKFKVKKNKLSLHYIIFASLIQRKLQMMGLKFYPFQKNIPGIPQNIIKESKIYGKIFKKSQILGRWEERFIVINQTGLYSYKKFNQKHSMFISCQLAKQLWTRFQIVDENLLVIKLLHSSGTKTEFGIPINEFVNQENWLYYFYQMGMRNI